jgi:hypothetical protein
MEVSCAGGQGLCLDKDTVINDDFRRLCDVSATWNK